MKTKINIFILISVSIIFCNCSKVPITDRNQLLLVPESQMISMGATNYRAFLDTMHISTDVIHTQQLNQVGNDIARAVETYLRENGQSDRISDFNWEFKLVDSELVNAWCMPGGKICFYTGILPYTQNPTGMAVVMGHEVAHAVARHSNERMTQQLLQVAGGIALSEFMSSRPQQTQNIFLSLYSIGTQFGITLPYSRAHETEADKLGLIFMAMAGYNPEEAISFWTRMAQNSSSVPEIISTHPSNEHRIQTLRNLLPEAMEIYNNRN